MTLVGNLHAGVIRPQVCPQHSTTGCKAVSVWARLYDFPYEAEGALARQRRETLPPGAAKAGRRGNGNSCTRRLPDRTALDHPEILEGTVSFLVFGGRQL